MGLREELLGIADAKITTVHVPEWNRAVLIRAMTGAERDAWEQSVQQAARNGKQIANFRAKLAALVVCDEQGNRVFSDADAEALGKKNGAALDRIFNAWLEQNALSKKEVEELEKNS